jgi:hypothetical protein
MPPAARNTPIWLYPSFGVSFVVFAVAVPFVLLYG